MKKMSMIATALAAWFVAVPVRADGFVAEFTEGMPEGVTIETLDASKPMREAYNNRVADDATWFVGRVEDGNMVALCPTCAGVDRRRVCRMTLPEVQLPESNPGLALTWRGRNMLKGEAECYDVLLREVNAGSDDAWQTIASAREAGDDWAFRGIDLTPYAGKRVQMAFQTKNEGEGALLGIDDICVGKAGWNASVCSNTFISESEQTPINLKIDYYGQSPRWQSIAIYNKATGECIQRMPYTCDGSATGTTYKAFGETGKLQGALDYVIKAQPEDGSDEITIATGRRVTSKYRRTLLVDRFTGTWCNNCPGEEATLRKLRRDYGDQIIIVEAHCGGNDPLLNAAYWNDYASDMVYAVPMLGVNHNKLTVGTSAVSKQAFDEELLAPTICAIEGVGEHITRDVVDMQFSTSFAQDIDNADRRFAIGYMVLRNYHGKNRFDLQQSNAASLPSWGGYYYMGNYLLPQHSHFENVVIDGSNAVKGIDNSLPATIKAGEAIKFRTAIKLPQEALNVPEYEEHYTLIAMVIDRQDGRVLNCGVPRVQPYFSNVPDAKFEVTPSCERPLKQLSGVVSLTFPALEDDGVVINDSKVKCYDSNMQRIGEYRLSMGDVPHVVRFTVTPAITDAGTYMFYIDEGALANAETDAPLSSISLSYKVVPTMFGDGSVRIEPDIANQKIDALEGDYTLYYDNHTEMQWGSTVLPCRVLVFEQSNTSKAETWYHATVSGNKVSFTASPAFTKGGKYYLEIDGFVDADNMNDVPMVQVPFSVSGDLYEEEQGGEEKPKIDWSYTLTPPNDEPLAEFPKRIIVHFTQVRELTNSSSFVTITGPSYNNKNVRMPNLGRVDDVSWTSHYIDRPSGFPKKDGTYTVIVGDQCIQDEDSGEYAPGFSFSYVVDATGGIGAVAVDGNDGAVIYDLYGRRRVNCKVEDLAPGLYVIDGEKKIIK